MCTRDRSSDTKTKQSNGNNSTPDFPSNDDTMPQTMSSFAMAIWLLATTILSLLIGRHHSSLVKDYWGGYRYMITPVPTSTNTTAIEVTKPRLPSDKSWLQPESSNDEASADETCISPALKQSLFPIAAAKTTAELLVHPLLLNIHPAPKSVAVSGLPIFEDLSLLHALISEIQSHASVDSIYIGVDLHKKEQERALRMCEEISETFTETTCQVQCLDLRDMKDDELSFQVDAVILPFSDNVIGADAFIEEYKASSSDDEDEEEEEDIQAKMQFWFDHLSDHGALITPLGNTHALETIRMSEDEYEVSVELEEPPIFADRFERIDALSEVEFERVIDFDIPANLFYYSEYQQKKLSTTSSFPVNIGVAFKSTTGIAYWRWNEAHYQKLIHERLQFPDGFVNFDAATMLQLQNAPIHSSWWFCGSFTQAVIDKGDCAPPGYDPLDPNVLLDDLYVSKSLAGENAGRGVFANVDIAEGSHVSLETTTNSIHYEWMTTQIQRDMMDEVEEYSESKSKIVHVYAEAYGYESNPFGMPQEAVMSHFLTFVNHGCNGTSNLGERGVNPSDYTEWSVDLDEEIPKDLRSAPSETYNPNTDRNVVKFATNCVAARDINKGEELYDNYMNYGGDEFFAEMVQELREQCSGELGLVEQYQTNPKTATVKFANLKDEAEECEEGCEASQNKSR